METNNKKLIEDVFRSSNWKVMECVSESVEDFGKKFFYVEGVFSRAGVKNSNNTIYPVDIYKREIERIQPLIKNGEILMQLDHPEWYKPESTRNISGIVIELLVPDKQGFIFGKARIPYTDAGKDLIAVIEADGNIGISSRGYATRNEVLFKNGTLSHYEIGEDFYLESFDFVINPAVKKAKNLKMIYENQEPVMNREQFENKYPELHQEIVESVTKQANDAHEVKVTELTKTVEESTAKVVALETELVTLKETNETTSKELCNSILESVAKLTGIELSGKKEVVKSVETSEALEIKNLTAKITTMEVEISKQKAEAFAAVLSGHIVNVLATKPLASNFKEMIESCKSVEEVDLVVKTNTELLENFKAKLEKEFVANKTNENAAAGVGVTYFAEQDASTPPADVVKEIMKRRAGISK